MDVAIDSYLHGEESGRQLLEELLVSEDFFWDVQTFLTDNLEDSDCSVAKCKLCFILIIRRLNLNGHTNVACGDLMSLLASVRHLQFAHNVSIIDPLAQCLAKVALASFEDPVAIVYQIYSSGCDHPVLNLRFLSEVALTVSQATQELLTRLQDISDEIMQYCVLSISKDGNSTVTAAALACAATWLHARLVTHGSLVQAHPSETNPSMPRIEVICRRGMQMAMGDNNVLSAMADFLEELLVVAHDTKEVTAACSSFPISSADGTMSQTDLCNSSDSYFPPYFIAKLSDIINSVLTDHGDVFDEEGGAPSKVSTEWTHSYCRTLASAIKFSLFNSSNPFVDIMPADESETSSSVKGYAVLHVAQQLCRASNSGTIGVAAVAMEVMTTMLTRLSVSGRALLVQRGLVHKLSEGCLKHFCAVLSMEHDPAYDLDEWLMHREQVVCDAFHSCYVNLRAAVLHAIVGTITSEIHEFVSGRSTLDRSVSIICGNIRALRSIGIDLSKRAQLVGASSSTLFNTSRAGKNAESSEDIKIDANLTSETLVQIIVGLVGVDDSSILSYPEISIETLKFLGMLSGWISKGKLISDQSSGTSSGNTPLGSVDSMSIATNHFVALEDVFTVIGGDLLTYMQTRLNSPQTFHCAASALRSYCAQCGRHIAQYPEYISRLMSIWRDLCSADHTQLRVQIAEVLVDIGAVEESALLGSGGDGEEGDILCEVMKSFVQAIAMVLKHIVPAVDCGHDNQYAECVSHVLTCPYEILSSYAYLESSEDIDPAAARNVAMMVQVVATAIRSIRVHLPTELSVGSDDDSSSAEDEQCSVDRVDISCHPIFQEISHLSNDDLLGTLSVIFSKHHSVCDALAHLCTSMVTFIAPMIRHSQLQYFCSSIFNCYIQPIADSTPVGTCEFVMELLEIVGGVVQYNRSKALIQSTYGKNCPDAIVRDLETLLAAAVGFIFDGSADLLSLISSAVGSDCNCGDFDFSSGTWMHIRQEMTSNKACISEHLEICYRVLRSVFESTRCLCCHLPLLLPIVCAAVLTLPNTFDNTSLSHSAVLLLQSVFTAKKRNLDTRSTFGNTTATPTDAALINISTWEKCVSDLVLHLKYPIAVECIVLLLFGEGTHSELMVEAYTSMLHVCVMEIRAASGGFFAADECSRLVHSTAQCRGLSMPSSEVAVVDVLRVIDSLTGAATSSFDCDVKQFSSDDIQFGLFTQFCTLLGDLNSGKALPHNIVDFAGIHLKN